MKPARAVLVLAGCALLVLHCTRRQDAAFNKLPELPPELAANLVPSQTAPVLVTRAPQPTPPRPPSLPPPPAINRAQFCTARYVAYVPFPMTICYSFSDLVANVLENPAQSPRVSTPRPEPPKYYKLTSKRNLGSFFCRVSGGPWYAAVHEQESCSDSLPTHCVLEFLSAPEHVVMQWDGTLKDVPPPINPNLFALAGRSCSCCPGFKTCNGGCVPQQVTCSNSPA